MKIKIDDQKIEDLHEMGEEVDKKVRQLSQFKGKLYNQIAEKIEDEYGEVIVNDFDEISSVNTVVSNSPESGIDKTIIVSLQPDESVVSSIEDLNGWIDFQDKKRDEMRDKYPVFQALNFDCLIEVDYCEHTG